MRKIKQICGCFFTIGILLISLKILTDTMERKGSDDKYGPFFEQEEDFDILFLGTSHVINGIFPMELWQDYGFISYNFGGHSNTLATSYWVTENALDYTDPKLIVIDCLGISGNTKTSDNFSHVHLSMDAFPISFSKCSSVFDLLDDNIMDEIIRTKKASGVSEDSSERTRMSLLWDYSVYHSRWNELSESDFNRMVSREKGAESRIAVNTTAEMTDVLSDKKLDGDSVSIDYLRKMITNCKNRGIEVLLLYLPFSTTEQACMEANRVYDIAEEHGVNYINFLSTDIVDYSTDFYDQTHLNPSGARKITNY